MLKNLELKGSLFVYHLFALMSCQTCMTFYFAQHKKNKNIGNQTTLTPVDFAWIYSKITDTFLNFVFNEEESYTRFVRHESEYMMTKLWFILL